MYTGTHLIKTITNIMKRFSTKDDTVKNQLRQWSYTAYQRQK